MFTGQDGEKSDSNSGPVRKNDVDQMNGSKNDFPNNDHQGNSENGAFTDVLPEKKNSETRALSVREMGAKRNQMFTERLEDTVMYNSDED